MTFLGKRSVVACLVVAALAVRAAAQTAPRVQLPMAQPAAPLAAPTLPTAPTYPPGYAPGYAAPPYAAPPYAAPPAGAGGGIFSVPPGATPAYAPPPGYGSYTGVDPRFAQGPSSVFPPAPYSNPYPGGTNYYNTPDGGISQYTKFIQGITLEHTWLAGDDGTDLDQNDTDIAVTFALPIFPNPKNPLYVSPGFGLHLWDGPTFPDSYPADLPAQAYDAYLDVTWRPQFNEVFGMELAIRPGIYSSFDAINSHSIRIQGRGLGFVRLSPAWQLALGAVYLDRLNVKLLPAGGLIWTPNEKNRLEFLFPKPKLSRYLMTAWTNTEWWIYATGEYGGGSWTIERSADTDPAVAGMDDQIDINDIRVMLGLEFKPTQNVDGNLPPARRAYVGYFEIGYAFEREIIYRSEVPSEFNLPETFLFRGGIRF
ncbi:MAG: hypothetical protein WD875_03210 [Pirellulales bacterium]